MINLKEIELGPFTNSFKNQRKSSKDSRINSDTTYLVKIYGNWYAGKFTNQWYGWNFHNWGGSGIQLDCIEGPIYEINEE